VAETSAPKSPFEDPDLRRRIFRTLGALAIFRVGAYMPLPGADAGALKALVDSSSGGLPGFLDAVSGGALGRFSLFSLGVIPFVNASIIAGLLKLGRGRRERGEAARRLTLILALLQAFAMALWLARTTAPGGAPVVAEPGLFFYGATTLTLTAGSLFTMWLCEEITESGIGGGTLLIVFAGLVGNVLAGASALFKHLLVEEIGLAAVLAILAAVLAFVVSTILVETAQRKLTVHYAQRIVGRRMYGGSQSALPLKLDQSGVVAAVLAAVGASSLAALLLAAARFFPQSLFARRLPPLLSRGGWLDDAIYAALIVFFCLVPGARTLDPNELADKLKKAGGSIQGIRPGEPTARHILWIHDRLAPGGALLVAAIAVLPDLLRRGLGLPFFFDGLQLLVVVGVALDVLGRVESHAMMRAYAKFNK
jgi:preprotein translocase subunit SecY